MDNVMNVICSLCSAPFSSRGSSQNKDAASGQLPLVLHCGHTYCQNCLGKFSAKLQIPCPDCKEITILKEERGGLHQLPLNYTILGLNSSTESRRRTIFSKQNSRNANNTATAPVKVSVPCSICSSQRASCQCMQCCLVVCTPCFQKIHNASPMMKSHNPISLTSADLNVMPLPNVGESEEFKCLDHPNKLVEYYCTVDAVECCSYCAIRGKHQGHKVLTMEEMAPEAVKKLPGIMAEGRQIISHLRRSHQQLSAASIGSSSSASQHQNTLLAARRNIQTAFQRVHALLAVRESAMLDEVDELYAAEEQSKISLVNKISSQLLELERLLAECQRALVPESPEASRAQLLLTKLRNVGQTPCVVSFAPVEVKVHENIVELLQGVVSLHNIPTPSFQLLSLEQAQTDGLLTSAAENAEFSEEHESTSRRTSLSEAANALVGLETVMSCGTAAAALADDSATMSVTNETDNRRDNTPTSQRHTQAASQPDPVELVTVTHIVTPGQFMVQRCSDKPALNKMLKKINEYCRKSRNAIPPKIEIGQRLLAQYAKDSNWYRVRVTNVDFNTPNSPPKVEINYIDYGNSEVVHPDRLRMPLQEHTEKHPFALKCSLFGIVPPKDAPSGEWPKECTTTMLSMTNNKTMALRVFRTRGDQLLVDLRRSNHDDLFSDQPASMRDALVLLGFACYQTNIDSPGSVPQVRSFQPPTVPAVGTDFSAELIFHYSPDSFYLVRTDHDDGFAVLSAAMQEQYDNDRDGNYNLYCPQKGLLCAARYTNNNAWYRAVVTETSGLSKITVQYVDYGNSETLPLERLKWLSNDYLEMPVMAIHCSLADVAPAGGGSEWSEKAVTLMTALYAKNLTVKVVDVVTKDKLLVVIYPDGPDNPSFNAQLVEQCLAASTGPHSLQELSKQPKQTRRSAHSAHKADRSMLDSYPEPAQQQQQKNKPRSSTAMISAPALRAEIVISYFESPSNFYIQQADSDAKARLKLLQEQLARMYESTSDAVANWNCGDYCVVRDGKNWYRGQVVSVGAATIVVTLIDYGRVSEVTVDNMRALQDDVLMKTPCFARRCHLADLQPAGGSGKWSQTACDIFREEVETDNTKLCLVVKDEGKDKATGMSVDLLLECHEAATALMPERRQYFSMIGILRERGVALPTRRTAAIRKQQLPTIRISEPSTPLTDYLPPVTPEELAYEAVPTYVDIMSVIYLQAISASTVETRLSHVLRETTLEVVIQDRRLTALGLYRAKMPRDCNCLFRACAQALLGNQQRHAEVRRAAASLIRTHWDLFLKMLPDSDKDDYVAELLSDGFYGGDIEIQAISAAYDAQISMWLGGVELPFAQRTYGPNEPKVYFSLIHVADEEHDNGHYDLVVGDSKLAASIDSAYVAWREDHVKNVLGDVRWTNASKYEDSLLGQLMTHLERTYGGTQPEGAGSTWRVGQPVVARSKDDETFYRAKILASTPRGYNVQYIDFGNAEVLPADRLRLPAALLDIPPQCFGVLLHATQGTDKDGGWTLPALNYLHQLVVGKTCHVNVKMPATQGNMATVSLTLPDGDDVSRHMCQRSFALPCKGMHVDSVPLLTVTRMAPSPYSTMVRPDVGEECAVNVIHVESADKIFVQYALRKSDSIVRLHDTIQKQQNELVNINSELNVIYHTLELVPPERIIPGLACCGQFSEDQLWYRAEVISVDSSTAHILFVDFGNSDRVPFSCIRQLPANYLVLPCQVVSVVLAHVRPARGQAWAPEVTETLVAKLLNKEVTCIVVDNNKDAEGVMMSVELFVGKSRDVPFLAYYPLIRGGYMVYTPVVNSPPSLSTPTKLSNAPVEVTPEAKRMTNSNGVGGNSRNSSAHMFSRQSSASSSRSNSQAQFIAPSPSLPSSSQFSSSAVHDSQVQSFQLPAKSGSSLRALVSESNGPVRVISSETLAEGIVGTDESLYAAIGATLEAWDK